MSGLVTHYETLFQANRSFFENQFSTGGYYKTVISGAIQAFGWDMLLTAAAGAEGFIFEPTNDFEWVVRNFGATHCLVGSAVDCRTMTFNGWDAVQREIDLTLSLAPQCAGLIWAVGNHMPANIPTEIGLRYMEYLRARWSLTS